MVGNRKEGLDAGKDGWTGTNGTAKTATIRAGCRVMAHTLHVEVWHLAGDEFFFSKNWERAPTVWSMPGVLV